MEEKARKTFTDMMSDSQVGFEAKMSSIQTLRAFVNQRLTVAVEEIFQLLETTICNYEEEIDRQRRLLEEVSQPHYLTDTAGLSVF